MLEAVPLSTSPCPDVGPDVPGFGLDVVPDFDELGEGFACGLDDAVRARVFTVAASEGLRLGASFALEEMTGGGRFLTRGGDFARCEAWDFDRDGASDITVDEIRSAVVVVLRSWTDERSFGDTVDSNLLAFCATRPETK